MVKEECVCGIDALINASTFYHRRVTR